MILLFQFTGLSGNISNPNYFESGESFTLGEFEITPFLMDHSAFDNYAFLIKADGKSVIYSGDFRRRGRKEKVFKWFLHNTPQSVDALILEGTLFGRDNHKILTEYEIEDKMVEIEDKTPGMILIHQSSQNIDRLVSFYKASLKTNRLFVIDIYTAHVLGTLKKYANLPYPSRYY